MLNYAQLKALKPEKKMYAVTVYAGLQLRIFPSGTKTWHVNKSIKGKRIIKDLGTFPEVSLNEAKEYIDNLVNDSFSDSSNFKKLYLDWLDLKKKQIKNWKDIDSRFQKYILPVFADRSFKSINPPELITLLKENLEGDNKLETIKRICIWFKQLEIFGVNSGRLDTLRFQGINQVFPAPKPQHIKSIHYTELPQFWTHILTGSLKANNSLTALYIAFYTLVRPSEYCNLEWDWVNFNNKTITIPASYMKTKEEHIVPISSQLLNLLFGLTRINKYILPSPDKPNNCLSIATIPRFFKRHNISYLQPHGIRSIGRT